MTEIKYDKILWQEFKGFLWYISCIFQRDSVVVVFFKRNLSITGVDFEIYICADNIPSAESNCSQDIQLIVRHKTKSQSNAAVILAVD